MDLTPILREWPHDDQDESRNIRVTQFSDGRRVIQVRQPLGILQMEYEGRPDGLRPMGYESWLAYYRAESRDSANFSLGPEEMENLMPEGMLYYQRRLIFLQIHDWVAVRRDSLRNLGYFDFVKQYASEPTYVHALEQYRPYLIRMRALAESKLRKEQGRFDEAILALRAAAREIEGLDDVPTEVYKIEKARSLHHLQELIEAIQKEKPESRREQLERLKNKAVDEEDFELAARLRDQLRELEAEGREQSV